MLDVVYITPDFAVTGAIAPADFATLRKEGFRTIINNRRDDEDDQTLASATEAAEAARQGLSYTHVPARPHELFTDPVLSAMQEAMAQAAGPVLAHCKSGQRSAILWAAVQARSEPVSAVLAALAAAGLDLAFLRDDLDRQAGRSLWRNGATLDDRQPDLVAQL